MSLKIHRFAQNANPKTKKARNSSIPSVINIREVIAKVFFELIIVMILEDFFVFASLRVVKLHKNEQTSKKAKKEYQNLKIVLKLPLKGTSKKRLELENSELRLGDVILQVLGYQR